MFRINSVTLHNFKSYKGDHQLEFPTKSGLYFLTGINEREPKLGSNGAGKSTLLDAIYWCLYGHTTRGLKASDVVTWGQHTCMAALDITVANLDLIITRKQNPNSLTIDGQPVDQVTLEKHIGLNAESFLYAVILPQFGRSFFELKPSEKLTLFSDILGLEFWLEKSREASVTTDVIAKKITKLGEITHDTKVAIIDAKTNLKEFRAKSEEFEESRENSIGYIKRQIDQLSAQFLKYEDKREAVFDQLKSLNVDREDKLKEYDKLVGMVFKQDQHKVTLKTDHAVLTAALANLKGQVNQISSVGAVCSRCKQEVNQTHLRNEKSKLMKTLGMERMRLGDLNAEITNANKMVEKATKNADNVKHEMDSINAKVANLRVTYSTLKVEVDNIQQKTLELRKEIKIKRAEGNPFDTMISTRQHIIEDLESRLILHNEKFERLNEEYVATEFWVAGFKRVRLFIIESAIKQLEIEVNNSLASLGLEDWSIEFDVERENKAGGVTKGFVVFIRCPSNPEPVKWESWSGGETQRLQLAGDFGLANLIMMQAGLSNTIEFYDEPSDHLSDEGLNDLAETLHQRALRDDKTIWLVDHRMPEFGDFTATLQITKNEEGSVLG